MTKERLRKYRDLKREQLQIKQQLEQTRLELEALDDAVGVDVARIKAAYRKIMALYCRKADVLSRELMAIEQAIGQLDTKERTLLRHYYIDGLTWDQVCEEMHYGWTQVHNIHSGAVEKLRRMKEPEE